MDHPKKYWNANKAEIGDTHPLNQLKLLQNIGGHNEVLFNLILRKKWYIVPYQLISKYVQSCVSAKQGFTVVLQGL